MSTNSSTSPYFRTIPKEIIAHYLPPNPVIVEAGAHIGRDTKKMYTIWPKCTIHAFEPVPELFAELTKNVAKYSNVFCYPYALSSQIMTTTLYKSGGRSTATSSLYEPMGYLQEHPETFFTPITVQTITLDSWAKQNTIHTVDMLWLDMQGGELAALQGAQELLKRVSVIHTEVALNERYKNAPLYPEIKNWLEKHGFSVAYEALGKSHWGNVLFVRK